MFSKAQPEFHLSQVSSSLLPGKAENETLSHVAPQQNTQNPLIGNWIMNNHFAPGAGMSCPTNFFSTLTSPNNPEAQQRSSYNKLNDEKNAGGIYYTNTGSSEDDECRTHHIKDSSSQKDVTQNFVLQERAKEVKVVRLEERRRKNRDAAKRHRLRRALKMGDLEEKVNKLTDELKRNRYVLGLCAVAVSTLQQDQVIPGKGNFQ